MPRHEFGIMQQPPLPGRRYDEYEPEKYDCITVDDAYIEPLLPRLVGIGCYWHTLDVPGEGLAYCGVTLIPPGALDAFLAVINGADGLDELRRLMLCARAAGSFMIHFGI